MLGDVWIFGGFSLSHPRNVWISTNPKSQAFSHQVSNGLSRRNLSWSHRPDWLAQDPEKTSWLGELAAKGGGKGASFQESTHTCLRVMYACYESMRSYEAACCKSYVPEHVGQVQ